MTSPIASAPDGQAMAGLVSGIAADARELLDQHVSLVRAEIKTESRRALAAGFLFAIGAAVAIPAIELLATTIANFLHEVEGMPMWGGDAIVGGLLAVISACLIVLSIRRFQSFNPFPDQSVAAFKESVRWVTNPK